MVFFWACEVTETKAAVVKIPESYVLNVCHATIASASNEGVVSLGVEAPQMDGKLWKGVVAHLGAAAHAHQVKLDLVVGGGSAQVKFYVAKGTGKVNLTGYFQPGPPADLFEDQIEIAAADEKKAAPAQAEQQSNKNKKRAREEKKADVTWDQAASDSEDSETEKTAKPAEPVKKQPKKEENPKASAPKPQQQQQQQNGASEGEKKKKKKNKNKNKNKPTN